MQRMQIIGEVDTLGYCWCVDCHPSALEAGQMIYPVAIYSDSCGGDEVCEGCKRNLSQPKFMGYRAAA